MKKRTSSTFCGPVGGPGVALEPTIGREAARPAHRASRLFLVVLALSAACVDVSQGPWDFETEPEAIGEAESAVAFAVNTSGPIRSIVRTNGKLFGGKVVGSTITTYISGDEGQSWVQSKSIASSPTVGYGDISFVAVPGSNKVFAAFREETGSPTQYKVVICKNDDPVGGKDWTFDTVVDGPYNNGKFVGAPFLFIDEYGNLQIYYDSEPAATSAGRDGHQYIVRKKRVGLTGAFSPAVIAARRKDSETSYLTREGMPSVVRLAKDRLMVITEGVEKTASGGVHANVIYATQSFDNGGTWDFENRKVVYEAGIHSSGKRYNSYVPWGIVLGGGPVAVAFVTDESLSAPYSSSAGILDRRGHVKYVLTTINYETWSSPAVIFNEHDRNYAPGAIDRGGNSPLVTIDQWTTNPTTFYQRFISVN